MLYEAGCQWLKPIILATQQIEIRTIKVHGQPRQKVRLYLKNIQHQKGLVEWLT
jgi:hypothetical protein